MTWRRWTSEVSPWTVAAAEVPEIRSVFVPFTRQGRGRGKRGRKKEGESLK